MHFHDFIASPFTHSPEKKTGVLTSYELMFPIIEVEIWQEKSNPDCSYMTTLHNLYHLSGTCHRKWVFIYFTQQRISFVVPLSDILSNITSFGTLATHVIWFPRKNKRSDALWVNVLIIRGEIWKENKPDYGNMNTVQYIVFLKASASGNGSPHLLHDRADSFCRISVSLHDILNNITYHGTFASLILFLRRDKRSNVLWDSELMSW